MIANSSSSSSVPLPPRIKKVNIDDKKESCFPTRFEVETVIVKRMGDNSDSTMMSPQNIQVEGMALDFIAVV